MNAVFGYGSLIRPTSIAERHNSSWTDAVYRTNNDFLVHPDARKRWKKIQKRITVIPVQLSGYKRCYSYKSQRGGTMLEVYRGNDTINGIIYTGLTDKEYKAITAYEDGYRKETIQKSDPYLYPVQGIDHNDLPDTITVYHSKKTEPPEPENVSRKNVLYHRRILHGIEKELADLFTSTMAHRFRSDFLTSTQEARNGEWTYLT